MNEEELGHYAPKYQKIRNLFRRSPDTHDIVATRFATDILEYLAQNFWYVQEKIDGTNVRIIWDGDRVSFGSKNTYGSDNLPGRLREHLEEHYGGPEFEHLLEQEFGSNPVTIYGEGYGHKIQTGAGYFPDDPEGRNSFLAFDVRVNGHYLGTLEGRDQLGRLGVPRVPQISGVHTIPSVLRGMEAAAATPDTLLHNGTAKEIEGYVLRPIVPLFDANRERVLAKALLSDVRQLRERNPSDLARWTAGVR